jgi:GTP cyclohydrolase IIa
LVQITIIKINDYGPWTLTLGSDREHELQMLQASLYKEIQKLFSEKNCLAFLNTEKKVIFSLPSLRTVK